MLAVWPDGTILSIWAGTSTSRPAESVKVLTSAVAVVAEPAAEPASAPPLQTARPVPRPSANTARGASSCLGPVHAGPTSPKATSILLSKAAPHQDLANEFVQEGIIGKFSLQFELGWKLLKALLAYEGDAQSATGSPRDIIKAAWRMFDFLDEDIWLNMLRDRDNTAHVYDADLASTLVQRIIDTCLPAFPPSKTALRNATAESSSQHFPNGRAQAAAHRHAGGA